MCYVALCRGLRDETIERQQQTIAWMKRERVEQEATIHALRTQLVWSIKAYPCVRQGIPHVARLHAHHFVLSTLNDHEVYRLSYDAMRTYGAGETLFCWTTYHDGDVHHIRSKQTRSLLRHLHQRLQQLANELAVDRDSV